MIENAKMKKNSFRSQEQLYIYKHPIQFFQDGAITLPVSPSELGTQESKVFQKRLSKYNC
jgi:hypothetical protein